jgi:hypothetical protein
MERGITDTTSVFAEEGTAAHELGAYCLEKGGEANYRLGDVIYTSPDGTEWVVDETMAENVQMYVDAVRHYADGVKPLVEQKVDFSKWVPKGFGTGDAVILNGSEIQVHDLKYGRGVKVEAPGNEQLMLYALGAYHQFSALEDFETVKMVIHQPRLHHVSEDNITVEELLGFAERAKDAAEHTLQPDATCIAGEKQCLWCKAKASCPAAAKEVAAQISMDFDNLLSDKEPEARDTNCFTNEQLGDIYPKLDFIEDWCKAVRALVYSVIEEGENVPGYKMVAGRRGSRAWCDEETVIEAMKAMRLKADEMYNKKVISPAQAEKLLKSSKKKWGKIEDLITQSEGKPTVVPESDKREAIGSKADDFESLTD